MQRPDIGEYIPAVLTPFPPHPRRLHPSKRSPQLPRHPAIHPHQPRINLLAHPTHPRPIPSQKHSSKPVRAIIRQRHGLVFGREGRDGDHGPENLLLHDAAALLDVGEDRGLDPVPVFRRLRGHCSEVESGVFALGEEDIRADFAVMLQADHGAEGFACDVRLLDILDEGVDKGRVDGRVHVDTRAAEAYLALIFKGGSCGQGDRGGEIDVGEDEGGVFAAEF